MSMYGTRDAALNWYDEYSSQLISIGFVQGVATPCVFYHKEKGIRTFVHGDDYVSTGKLSSLKWMQDSLEKKYKIKTQELGRGEGQDPELRILNKIVRITPEGVELEADPRHAEMVIKDLKLQDAKPSTVPGSKEEMKKAPTREEDRGKAIDNIQ